MSQKKLYKSKVLKIALKQVGYMEKASNAFLDSKTLNAGYKNYTKYGRDYGWNGVAWCCIFVWWCMQKAYGFDYIKLVTKTASCEVMRQYFISKGRYGKTPKKGAVIFFEVTGKPGVANHTGIVKQVSSVVHTIEGNTSSATGVVDNGGCVAQKSYAKDYAKILGYGYPDYDTRPLRAPKAPLHKGAEGDNVAQLQRCLNRVQSAELAVDGEYGNATANAVKQFKVNHSMKSTDGTIYGKPMKKKLNKELK